jgi:transposase
MSKHDARRLPATAQEDLRRRVVDAIVNQGMSQADAVRGFGVSRTAVYTWLKKYRNKGKYGLKSGERGRPKKSLFKGHEAATIVRMITNRYPEQLLLPFALWTRAAVQQLLSERFDVHVSVWTVGRYLKRWGFTPQKPLRRAYERDPKKVNRWLEEDYPSIRALARKEKAEIHWGDEMGMRSDHQTGTSYGKKGRTPVAYTTGNRFSCNMISSITNNGKLAFMVFKGRFHADVMIDFLRRLIRNAQRKIFLILDGHPVHRSKKVKAWFEKHEADIRLFYLPGYSPELNPDEYLNQDVKSNAVGRKRARAQQEMMDNVRSYLRSTQKQPQIVRNYFRHRSVQYAA